MIDRLTKDQAVLVSAYTGYLICNFSDMHKFIEETMGRPVMTHEMASHDFCECLREKLRGQFIALSPKGEMK